MVTVCGEGGLLGGCLTAEEPHATAAPTSTVTASFFIA
jgi:hypothetical protein